MTFNFCCSHQPVSCSREVTAYLSRKLGKRSPGIFVKEKSTWGPAKTLSGNAGPESTWRLLENGITEDRWRCSHPLRGKKSREVASGCGGWAIQRTPWSCSASKTTCRESLLGDASPTSLPSGVLVILRLQTSQQASEVESWDPARPSHAWCCSCRPIVYPGRCRRIRPARTETMHMRISYRLLWHCALYTQVLDFEQRFSNFSLC